MLPLGASAGDRHALSLDIGRPDKPVDYLAFAGSPGSTAATPSGFMLNAKNVNGASPAFPHWWTRPNGSYIKELRSFVSVLPAIVFAPVPDRM